MSIIFRRTRRLFFRDELKNRYAKFTYSLMTQKNVSIQITKIIRFIKTIYLIKMYVFEILINNVKVEFIFLFIRLCRLAFFLSRHLDYHRHSSELERGLGRKEASVWVNK